MSEMIKRIAQAILSKVPSGYGMRRDEAEIYARAAIEAMRKPTKEMIEAGDRGAMIRPASDTWTAMIDAALAEE